MAFKERLKQLRKAKGLSQNELAEAFGYKSFTTIQKWEDGSSHPPAQTLNRLAQYFGVSLESLMDNEGRLQAVPILGQVRGGPLRLAAQEWQGVEWVSEAELEQGEYFYLEVMGDSMINARIYPGDLVFVRRQAMVSDGKIAVILVGEEATLKRVYFKEGALILRAENPAYPDLVFSADDLEGTDVQILGEVLHSKIRF